MKRIITIVFLIWLICDFSKGQLKTFDLSSYKLPEIKRKQLDLSFDLTESSRNDKIKYETSDNSGSETNFSNTTRLMYKSFVNTANYQGEQIYSVNFSPDFYRRKTDSDIMEKESDLSTGFHINSENRFYFNKLYFFEADMNGYGDFSSGKYTYEGPNTARDENYDYFLSVPLSIGYGRIEPVHDARLAIYIFEELQKQNRIAREPSEEEIIEFARLISKLKNERYFDYRLKRIAEIEQVDSFLQIKGFVNQADASYFTTVYDNWEYSAGPIRRSGIRLSLGINPVLYSNRIYRRIVSEIPPWVSKSDTRYTDNAIRFIASASKETPLNLYWQQSIGLTTSYRINTFTRNNKVTDEEYKYKGKTLNSSAYYDLAYYPNSRTSISSGIYLNAQYEILDFESEIRDEKRFGLYPGLMLDVIYYISPQLRLNMDFLVRYNIDDVMSRYFPETEFEETNYRQFYQQLNITFIYSIF